MDIEKVLRDINQRKESIEGKYSNLLEVLAGLEKELADIPVKYANRTKQFQKEKRKELEKKIAEKTKTIKEWKDKQMKDIEDWLIEKQNQIMEEAKKLDEELVERRNSFKISKENNTTQE